MKNNQNNKLRHQIEKLKFKLDNQEQVLLLEKPLKEHYLKPSMEKISVYSSILITVSVVWFGLFEFYNLNKVDKQNNFNSIIQFLSFTTILQ